MYVYVNNYIYLINNEECKPHIKYEVLFRIYNNSFN